MPVGFQDPWVTGSRLYFQRDAVNSVEQPAIDLGTIDVANPNFEIESLKLEDSDGGVKSTVDEQVTKVDEQYDITCSNLNLDNLALLFLADSPSAFTQTAEDQDNKLWAVEGKLIKVLDGDYDAASPPDGLFGLSNVVGVADQDTLTQYTVTDVTVGTKTITTSTDASGLSASDKIILHGTSDGDNSGTYTVVSATGAGPTDIVVSETIPGADSTGGEVIDDALVEDTDWEVANLERGFVRSLTSNCAGEVRVVVTKRAITGNRLLNPQSVKGAIQGRCWLIWGRGNNAQQTVREMRVSMVPQSSNLQVDDYSNFVLSATVLSDLQATAPAGRMLQWLGDLPTSS